MQLHGGGAASNPLVAALGARRTIGLRAAGAPPLDANVPYRYYQPEADRFLEVVRLAGADGPAEYPTLAVFDTEWDAAAALLPGIGPWVALHAGAAVFAYLAAWALLPQAADEPPQQSRSRPSPAPSGGAREAWTADGGELKSLAAELRPKPTSAQTPTQLDTAARPSRRPPL